MLYSAHPLFLEKPYIKPELPHKMCEKCQRDAVNIKKGIEEELDIQKARAARADIQIENLAILSQPIEKTKMPSWSLVSPRPS